MERLIKYFSPSKYQLDLIIDRTKEKISGSVIISGAPAHNIIKLHSVGLAISAVDLILADSEQSCTFQCQNDTIEITLPDQRPDTISLRLQYETSLNKNMQGCYLSTYNFNQKVERIAATQFESHYAREAFPCIDEPEAKAEFDISLTISDFETGDVVLANTELIETKQTPQGPKYIFATTPRMSTYLLAWVIGKFHKVEATNQHGVKVASYAALNQSISSLEFANEVAARALDYYDEKFGIKYPLTKLDQVALPDFEAGAMENWGLVTYRESMMLAEPHASVDTKQSVAVTITHELSHQWFGDLVTMAWWDDLWLNESFATIMEYCSADALYPELHVWQDFYTGDCVAALRRDCLPGVQAVQQAVHDPAEIATLFDGAIVYAKGARLVLMLMRLMGEDNFYKGVHDYFETYQYQNTVGDDLWKHLQSYADFDVKSLMHAWISQPGYPALQLSGNGQWQQQRFLIDGTTDDTKWPLPEVKDDMSGHYIIDLSAADFTQKLSDFDALSMEQKLRLLIDRMLLAKSRAVHSDSLLELLPKFVNEDASVWDILLSIINDLKIFFPHESAEEDMYRQFLRNIIYSRVRAIGVVSQSNETSSQKRLRNILLTVARFARDTEIIDQLSAQYKADLSKIDAETRGNVLMAKMLTSEADIFPELLQQYQTEPDPEIKDDLLGALAAVKLPENINLAMNLLSQPEIIRPQDHLFFYVYLLRNPKIRQRALDWLYENWHYVEQLTGEKSIEDYPRCMSGYINNRAEADQFAQFFRQHENNPVLKRTLAMAKAGIESKLALTEHESALVQAKLRTMAGN